MMDSDRRLKSLLILLVLLALLFSSPASVKPVSAATITVTNSLDSGPGSLRQAISDANPGDRIIFDPSLSGETITLTYNTLLIDKNLTIDGTALPDPITISGSNNMTVFKVDTLDPVILDSLVITDGKSKYGSGIENLGTLTVNNCTIYGNEALYEGGGIRNLGAMVVTNSTLSGNTVTSTFSIPSNGGGIFNQGNLTLVNSTLSTNSSKNNGGGIYNNGTLIVRSSTLSGNSAEDSGGGIYNNGTLFVTNSTLSNNSSLDGGGISNYVTLNLLNSTLSENAAGCIGGGIFNQGVLNFSNTIIANSSSGWDCYNGFGGTIGTANTNNIVENNPASPNDCGTPYATDNPLLGPLADNGGPTLTHALLIGSPAIDAGSITHCPGTDQRGVPRPIGTGCDIGAFEYGFVIYLPLVMK